MKSCMTTIPTTIQFFDDSILASAGTYMVAEIKLHHFTFLLATYVPKS